MPNEKPQNYKNHTKLDPPFHFFMAPVGIITVVVAAYRAVQVQTLLQAWIFVFCLAVLIGFFKIRIYALKVQDRVIRLEETLRMERLLPQDLKVRVRELSESQFVALRFASDGELPALVAKTLANGWKGKEIKQAILSWRPDYFRV